MKTAAAEPASPPDTEPDLEIDRIRWLETLTIDDIAIVGGKTASLGEMILNLQEKNINVPNGVVRGASYTRQGKRTYDEAVHRGTDPRGSPYYWIGSGAAPHVAQAPDTDYMAVHGGFISVCPLHLDLTHYPSLQQMQERWGKLTDSLHEVVEG